MNHKTTLSSGGYSIAYNEISRRDLYLHMRWIRRVCYIVLVCRQRLRSKYTDHVSHERGLVLCDVSRVLCYQGTCAYDTICLQRWVYPNPSGWGAASTLPLAAIANGNFQIK